MNKLFLLLLMLVASSSCSENKNNSKYLQEDIIALHHINNLMTLGLMVENNNMIISSYKSNPIKYKLKNNIYIETDVNGKPILIKYIHKYESSLSNKICELAYTYNNLDIGCLPYSIETSKSHAVYMNLRI